MFSSLKSESLGVAAENKPRQSRHLNVYVTEKASALDGEITFNPQTRTLEGTDAQGNPYSLSVTEDATITAEWIPFGSNRVTPPDMRRGEPVEIFRLADTDKYYWRSLGLRDDLRRLETVILAINANPNISGDGINIDECYFLEVSSHEKLITFGTSQKNNEAFRYNGQFNLGTGEVILEDDIGCQLLWRSGDEYWHLTNPTGTTVEIAKENITLTAPQGNVYLNAQQNVAIEAGQAITLKAGNAIYKEAPQITAQCDEFNIDSPTTSTSGNVSVQGGLEVAGGISMGSGGNGQMTVQGNLNLQGDVQVTGDMRCRNIYADNIN